MLDTSECSPSFLRISNQVGGSFRYGDDAAQSVSMITGTAKNIGIVYVDMRGIRRRAIVKRLVKANVKGHVHRSKL